MPFNGSGIFNLIFNWEADAAANIDIMASRMDQQEADMASSGFDNCLTRDGQGQATANLPMAGFRHTNVGNGVNRTDYAALGQVQDDVGINWVPAGGTANAITATFTPALTALADGQLAFFRATAANSTTTPTFAPNSLTAHTITKQGGTALVAGDIPAALAECILRYNLSNTRWELLNPATATVGTGAIGTSQIAASAVTYAKIQNESASTLLGNPTGSGAAPSEITLGTNLSFSSATLNGPTFFAPNIQTFLSGTSSTYTTPTNGGNVPLYLRVRMVGGGGGGGATATNSGTTGNGSGFSGWTAVGGNGGTAANATPGNGGTGGTNGTGTLITRLDGSAGGSAGVTASVNTPGGQGGNSFFGGGGPGQDNAAGGNAVTNSGSGGAGGGGSGGAGGGGGAGEFVEFIITSPASSYTYTVGASAAGGTAGTHAGGSGAAGRIEVIGYWQ